MTSKQLLHVKECLDNDESGVKDIIIFIMIMFNCMTRTTCHNVCESFQYSYIYAGTPAILYTERNEIKN